MKPLEKAQFISNWIKDYVEKMPNNAQSLIIGNFWRNRFFRIKYIERNDGH